VPGGDLGSRLAALSPERRRLLLRRIEAERDGPAAAEPPAPRLPLTAAQQRLWLAELTNPGNVAYNVFLPVRIDGPLDAAALGRSLAAIVDRHDALRARFVEDAGTPAVVLAPEGSFALEVRDLSHVQDRDEAERRLAEEEAARPFDLETGPLVRGLLAGWGPERATLLLTVHHVAVDNWSMGIFSRELRELYSAALAGRPAALPAPGWRHREVVAWEAARRERAWEAQLDYWREQLRGAPHRTEPPADRPRPQRPSFGGARVGLRLDAAATGALGELARRHGATLYMASVAALMTLLHRYTGQDDVVVGTDLVNRPRPEAERTIGFFANQVALRADLGGNPTAGELLERVAATCVGAYGNQEIPFQHVVRALGRPRDLGHLPLFQVKLGFLHFPPGGLRLDGLRVTPLPAEGTAKFDVEAILWVERGELTGFLEYSTDLFERPTVELMAERYRELLSAMARDGERRILDVALPGAAPVSEPRAAAAERFPFER
jgi:hypothetical protein